MAIGLITYDDASRREDLIDIVTNISVQETPLLSGLPTGAAAKQTLHEYPTDTFADYADNAQVESSAFTVVDKTQPTRLTNVTQIFADWIQVSDTEVAVDGVTEPYNYQIQKNLVEHAKDMELAFMAGSRASGSSGVARRLAGVINSLTTNATARLSGSSLGEADFNDIMQMIWAGTGMVATEVYCGATLKRDISGFTTGITKYVDANDKRLVRPVDVYESDFGVHKIFLHRNVPNGANAKALVAINPKYHLKSYLRATKVTPLAKDGDRTRAQIITEATLEHRGEKSGAYVSGFTS
jgi:hypothetical protein